MINVENVVFFYRKNRLIFNNFTLIVPKHCIMGLLGHNGAGKTTLLRLIVGILKPYKGTVKINGKNNKQLPRNFISYMPEVGGIYENLTLYENLVFRARTAMVYNNDFKYKAEQLLQELNLSDLRNEKAAYLSNGMKKRLLLACNLIIEPKIILLDEPTVGIDPESLDIIIELLRKYNKNETTIIISSHDMNTIQDLCSNITILREGKIMFEGFIENIKSIKDLYFKYC